MNDGYSHVNAVYSQVNFLDSQINKLKIQENENDMRDVERRKLDKFEREQAFMNNNSGDFPAGSVGGKAAAVLGEVVKEIHTLAGDQLVGEGEARQSVAGKDDALDDMWTMIRNMNRAANAFSDEMPNITDKFRLPRNRSQENTAATARAFITDAAPIKAKFVEYGLADDFLEQLQADIDAFNDEGTNADSGGEQRAAATEGLLDAAKRGMDISRKLDSIVKIKYQNNPQKLASWRVASHLEKAPKSKKDSPMND